MAENTHKGTELNNVKETWQQNEREAAANGGRTDEPALPDNDLQRVIKEEAAEYENANSADNVLPGERATVSDDSEGTDE
jgi:hypothetical protein